jgi:hypothetical protein
MVRQQYEQAWQEQQRRQMLQGQAAPPDDPYERGRREEREAVLVNQFNQACNTLFEKGRQEFGDAMADAVGALNAVGWGGRPDALAQLTQLPDGHRVYRQLAGDLDNAARVLSLPPMQMAMELARMSRGEAGASSPPLAEAPASPREAGDVSRGTYDREPVRRIGGQSRGADRPLDHPQVSMAEYIRRRDRDERGSRIRR